MGQEIEPITHYDESIVAATRAGLSDAPLVVPRLKLAQSLTTEVKAKDADEGDLLNSLTGEVYGRELDVIVLSEEEGRFFRDHETRQAYSVIGEPVVPATWPHQCANLPFIDCPDAEEEFRAAVKANEKDWGKGPGIATTYNFTLLVRDPEAPEGAGADQWQTLPVRLSLQRATAKEARNWITLLRLSRANWDQVYHLTTVDARSKKGDQFVGLKVKPGRKTTDAERELAYRMVVMIQGAAYDDDLEDEVADAPSVKRPAKAASGLGASI